MSILSIITFIFFGALAIQAFYWLSFMRLIFFKSQNKGKRTKPISILVCAWNEEKNLKELLPVLLEQDHPDYEIVVVDDRSIDGTYDYLLELREKHDNLKMVRVDDLPDHMNAKKFAVTLGVKAAKHDLVLLTDADCRPNSPSWAKTMSSSFSKDVTFVLGFSSYKFSWSPLNLIIQYETLLTGIHYLSRALWKSPYMGVGRNLSYKKSFFLKNKGFSGFQDVLGGDDDLLVNRYANGKNTAICISPDSRVESIPKTSWSSYLVQKRRHYAVGKHYRTKDKINLALFSLSQILFWICFVTLAILAVNPYLIAGGFGLRLTLQLIVMGVGAKKLSNKLPIILLPLLDLIYSVFLPTIGVPALLSKKNKWR